MTRRINKKHKRKRELYKRDPYCYYCRKEMILMETNGKEKYLPPNLATIEHLRSRLNPERGMDNKESTVLACKKCNKEASDRELAELPIEEIWRMSGSYPNRSKWRKKNEKVRIKKAD